MKAVLGLVFIFSGLYVGYAVLAGKFPNASTTTTPATSTPTPDVKIPGHSVGGPAGVTGGGGPDISISSLGIPSFVYGLDMPASRGMS